MKQPEEIKFDNYIAEVKSQLECNDASKDYATFDYSNEQIDKNLDYFESCLDKNLSSYKALWFFADHLDEIRAYNWRNHKRIINDLINKSK